MRATITITALTTLTIWAAAQVRSAEEAFQGIVIPAQQIVVANTLSGTVEEVLVRPGEIVRKGDLLARLSSVTLRDEMMRAEVAYRVAAARHKLAQSVDKQAQAQVEAELAAALAKLRHAETQLARSQRMAEDGVITQAESLDHQQAVQAAKERVAHLPKKQQ